MNKNQYHIIFNQIRLGKLQAQLTRLIRQSCNTIVFTLPILCIPLAVDAQITVDPSAARNQQPTILNTANGLPQINIQTPSAAGVSRNTYHQFDVDHQGAILNNARSATQTQLGGWVQGNSWLNNGTARIILNEITTSSPSLLHGYIEVAGTKAQVVIANPSGITCDGCGFINANHAVLTTGRPLLDNGNLNGYLVQRGIVTIQGKGLDARLTDYTDILARAVAVNAGIWANDLNITTGASQVNANHTQITPITPAINTAKPAFAIDTAQLGGMYAGKITLVATEAGVGVRNAGHIGASAGEVILTADGRLENSGQITSSTNTRIDTNADITNSGLISAGQNAYLTTRGDINNGGAISTETGDIVLTAHGKLDNSGHIISHTNTDIHATTGITNSGTVYAKQNTQLITQGNINNSGDIAAGSVGGPPTTGTDIGDITLTAEGKLDNDGRIISHNNTHINTTEGITNSGTIYAGLHVLLNTWHNIINNGSIGTDAGEVTLTTNDRLDNNGQISSATDTHVTASTGITSNGTMYAGGNIQLTTQGDIVNNSVIASLGDTLLSAIGVTSQINSSIDSLLAAGVHTDGSLSDSGNLTLNATQDINGHGQIFSGGDQTFTSKTIDLTDGQISARNLDLTTTDGYLNTRRAILLATQTFTANVAQALHNESGKILADRLNVTAHDLYNQQGKIFQTSEQSGSARGSPATVLDPAIDDTLVIHLAGNLDNSSGTIAGNGKTTLAVVDGQITNTQGTIESATDLAINAVGLSGDGKLLSEGDLSVRLINDYTHTGELQANGSAILETLGKITNLSKLLAGDTLTLHAATIDNTTSGEIAAHNTNLTTTSTLNNRGLIDGNNTHIKANTLNNLGTGHICGDHLMIDANTLINGVENNIAAVIAARQRLDIATQSLTNREHALLFSAGDMAIGSSLDADGKATGQANSVNNNSATIEALGNLDLSAKQIRNTNEHFGTQTVEVSQTFIQQYQLTGSPNRYRPDQISITFGETWFLNTAEGSRDDFNRYDYTRVIRETQVSESDPGKIFAGGMMHVAADNMLNDKSQIIAGGNLTGNIGTLTNTEIAGQRTITDTGQVHHYYRIEKSGTDSPGEDVADYYPPASVQAINLHPSTYQGNTRPQASGHSVDPITEVKAVISTTPDTPDSSNPSLSLNNPNTVIRTGGVNTTLPDNALFHINPEPQAGKYLIEADPRFANYKNWLSSDYMFQQLGTDPAYMQKRLGDGFYEQKLIREQVAQLTGRRFLQGYDNDEDEYRALINHGVTYAKKWELRPGIALTAEQMAQLTTDIVWLVEKDITLPDGSTTKALVPEVYVRVKGGDVTGNGALLSGNNIQFNLTHALTNSGTITGRDQLVLGAQNINNLGGRINSANTTLYATNDINNFGGTLDATKSLSALAGRDINVTSTTHSEQNAQGSRTSINRVAGISVSDPGGTLTVAAGHDLNLNAAQVINAGEGGVAALAAGHDFNLGTVNESNQNHITWNADNQRHDASSQDVGSAIQTRGDLNVIAGHDLNAKGASVSSEQGTLITSASNNINLTAATATQSIDEAHKKSGSNGALSKKTTTTRDTLSQSQALSTTFSANSTVVQAGKDINLTGANIVATQDTNLSAGNNIHLNTATGTSNASHFRQEKKSGIFSADGGAIGFTAGIQKQTNNTRDNTTTAVASTVGSIQGNINIQAGNAYQQTGSHVVAPSGDIDIHAKTIDIKDAQNIYTSNQESKFEQIGLSVSLTNPILSAMQTGQQMQSAAGQTKDVRMQALAGTTAGLAGKNAYDAYKQDPNSFGGIKLSIGIGAAKSESNSSQKSNTAVGSTVAAGHDVRLTAVGAGKDSNITVQGSNINAGYDVALKADSEIKLLAAKNTTTGQSSSKSSSGSVGVGIGASSSGASVSVDVSMSQSKGNSNGQSTTWTNTDVNAGNKLTLDSSSNTTLKGAVASGDQVVAHVGGNLNIESLQDTSNYTSSESSSGFSASIPIYGAGGGSVSANASKTNINSNFASVTQQSGIQAGDQGFQIDIKGNTGLTGGVITSTDQAIQDNKNTLSTGTLTTKDIQNQAEYNANSTSIGIDYSSQGDGVGHDQKGNAQTGAAQASGNTLSNINIKGFSPTPPVAMGANDSADSTTKSGISGANITITDNEKQQQLTGKDAQTTVTELNRDVATGKDTSNALNPIFDEQAIRVGFEITGALTREVGTFLENRAKESTAAQKALDQERKKPKDQQDPNKIAQLTQTLQDNQTWEMGGTGRRIVTALTAAASGNVTGSGTQFIQSAATNYLQALDAEKVKKIADNLGGGAGGEAARAALHAVLACNGATSQGQSCSTAATGAAASVVLNNLLDGISGQKAGSLTPEERQARENLVGSIIAGVTAEAGGDAAVANAAAKIEAENNFLLPAIAQSSMMQMPVIGGAIGANGSSDEYVEISALKKYLDSWGVVFDVASSAVDKVFNESDAAEVDAPVVNDKKPIRVDEEARIHILDGDKNGGGHRAGTGKPKKSEFPSDWSDEKVVKEIEDVVNDPKSSRALSKLTGREDHTEVTGTRDGINILVVLDPNGRIVTAHPTNVPRNPKNPRR